MSLVGACSFTIWMGVMNELSFFTRRVLSCSVESLQK